MRVWMLLLCGAMFGATQELEMTLAHGSAAEAQTRDELQKLLKQYDLADWVWTRKVIIERGAIPHSHPVLTLNTRDEGLRLLSAFVHEQYHWFETEHPTQISSSMADLKKAYPRVPVGGRDGATDVDS